MDALSDVLRVVGLTGGIFLDARFTAPWCILGKVGPEACKPFMTPPAIVICFHYITEGRCVIESPGTEPCEAGAGEAVLLPRNELHKLGSDLRVPSISADELIEPASGLGLSKIIHGGGGEPCNMTCGFLGADRQLEPFVSSLPAVLKLALRDTPGGAWISQSFRFASEELARGNPGAATIVSKMSELMFVEAVRRYVSTLPDMQTGFLAGLRDPAIGKALALMHTQLQQPWSAEVLADAVSLSRSAFADRFVSLMGMPPMKYLTNWRMQHAAQKLREGRQSIGEIAFDTGYDSEASFTRAFKREMGWPPATWRSREQEGRDRR